MKENELHVIYDGSRDCVLKRTAASSRRNSASTADPLDAARSGAPVDDPHFVVVAEHRECKGGPTTSRESPDGGSYEWSDRQIRVSVEASQRVRRPLARRRDRGACFGPQRDHLMRICSHCAEQVQDAAILCSRCRRDLPPPRQREKALPELPPETKARPGVDKARVAAWGCVNPLIVSPLVLLAIPDHEKANGATRIRRCQNWRIAEESLRKADAERKAGGTGQLP